MNEKIILSSFLDNFIYSSEEKCAAIDILDRFSTCKEAYEEFINDYYLPFKNEHSFDFDWLFERIPELAKKAAMEPNELNLLFIQLLAAHSEYHYALKGYSHELYIENFTDLVWKMRECKKVNGFYGSRTFTWFKGWLFADRVTLGRLQFEIINATSEYKSDNYYIKPGKKLVNVHIPEDTRTPFNNENCEKAFSMAREFFKKDLGDDITFRCTSWLLCPKHNDILPENSNIRSFLNSFEIDMSSCCDSESDLWRVFYTDKPIEFVAEYPENTTIQREYKKLLMNGIRLGKATGYRK